VPNKTLAVEQVLTLLAETPQGYANLCRLLTETQVLASMLRDLGVAKGDRVILYMPMVPEAVIAMLACAKIGAAHSVVFGGFSAEALRERINDAKAKVLITGDGAWRRGTVVPLKASVDEALRGTPTIEKVIVVRRVGEAAKIAMQPGKIDVQGPKGKLSFAIPQGITFEQKDGVLTALRATEEHRALHGLARALVANAVHGVTSGFKKELDIVGVGYRAELKGKLVSFALGKSHPIEFPIPEGIQVAVEKQTHIVVSGADKGQVGQVAADMRSLRPPDPYKQKGVRITGERLKKKAGKAGAKAGAA